MKKAYRKSILQNVEITQSVLLASRMVKIIYVVISSDNEKYRFSRQ